MRPIKFRAWDNETKKIYSVHSFSAHDDGTVELWSFDIDGEHKLTDYVLEQYTGVSDATGKPIYEGDILQNRKYKSVIKHIGTGFKADVVGYQNIYPFNGRDETVIGNIHENPELLEAD